MDNERVSNERLAELFEIHANSEPTTGAYMESNAEFVSILRDLLALRSPHQGEVGKPAGYLFRLRYGPDRWSHQLMFSDVLPKEGDYKELQPLYAQPSVPKAGERELIAAAQNVYDKLAGETTSVTIFDQERLGEALAAFKGGK